MYIYLLLHLFTRNQFIKIEFIPFTVMQLVPIYIRLKAVLIPHGIYIKLDGNSDTLRTRERKRSFLN